MKRKKTRRQRNVEQRGRQTRWKGGQEKENMKKVKQITEIKASCPMAMIPSEGRKEDGKGDRKERRREREGREDRDRVWESSRR